MMIDWFHSLHCVLQAFIAGLLTWFVTALGAAVVFGFLRVHRKLLDAMLGFAGGRDASGKLLEFARAGD